MGVFWLLAFQREFTECISAQRKMFKVIKGRFIGCTKAAKQRGVMDMLSLLLITVLTNNGM